MIALFLSPGSVSADKLLYEGQGAVQAAMILIAVISIPWMWFFKPCIHKRQHEKQVCLFVCSLLLLNADR